MKKYLSALILFALLISVGSVAHAQNAAADPNVAVTSISASLVTSYNPVRPNTPFLVATHIVKVKPVKDMTFYCIAPKINKIGSKVYSDFNSQQVTCSMKGLATGIGGAYKLVANSTYDYTVTFKIDSNEMFQGAYSSSLDYAAYNLGGTTTLSTGFVAGGTTNTLAVVGETGPYVTSITQSGDTVAVTGQRFSKQMTLSVAGGLFSVSAQPAVDTDATDTISFSQKAFNISQGNKLVTVSGDKGASNTYWFNFSNNQASSTQPVVTPVSASITTKYNPNKPDSPLLVSTHTVKIKAANGPIYLSQYPTAMTLINSSNGQASWAGGQGVVTTTNAPVYGPGLYGQTAWVIAAGSEYSFTFTGTWDSSVMFAGTYSSSLNTVNYLVNPAQTAANSIAVSQKSNTLAVVGERSPFITSVSPTYPNLVAPGQKITVTGQNLSGVTASIITVSNNVSTAIQVTSSSSSTLSAVIPAGTAPGNYYLQLNSAKYGKSMVSPILIGSGPFISNVSVKGDNTTWTQGTVKDVAWQTGGGIANVDVLVCSDSPTTCFYAYKNAVNNGYSSNVKVGFNMPASTASTTKSGYIKIQQTNNPSLFSISPKFKVVAPSPVTPVGTTTPPIGTTTSQTASAILSIQALIDSIQAILNAQ